MQRFGENVTAGTQATIIHETQHLKKCQCFLLYVMSIVDSDIQKYNNKSL